MIYDLGCISLHEAILHILQCSDFIRVVCFKVGLYPIIKYLCTPNQPVLEGMHLYLQSNKFFLNLICMLVFAQ